MRWPKALLVEPKKLLGSAGRSLALEIAAGISICPALLGNQRVAPFQYVVGSTATLGVVAQIVAHPVQFHAVDAGHINEPPLRSVA